MALEVQEISALNITQSVQTHPAIAKETQRIPEFLNSDSFGSRTTLDAELEFLINVHKCSSSVMQSQSSCLISINVTRQDLQYGPATVSLRLLHPSASKLPIHVTVVLHVFKTQASISRHPYPISSVSIRSPIQPSPPCSLVVLLVKVVLLARFCAVGPCTDGLSYSHFRCRTAK